MSAHRATGGDIAAPSTFLREERFIVLKRKHLKPSQEAAISALFRVHQIRTVESVVVEADWPEYELVWAMIEARATGTPTPGGALGLCAMALLRKFAQWEADATDPADDCEFLNGTGWEDLADLAGQARALLAQMGQPLHG